MAAPIFSFFSIYQPGFTLTQNGSFAGPMVGSLPLTSYCPGLEIAGAAEGEIDVSASSLSEGWFRFSYRIDRSDANRDIVIWKGATTDLLRFRCLDTTTADSEISFDYYDGAAWQQIANIGQRSTYRIDVHWKIADAGGNFTVYAQGRKIAEFTGDTLRTGDTTIETIRLLGADAVTTTYATEYWNMHVDSVDTRGLQWTQQYVTGQGFYEETGGTTGTYLDTVNEGLMQSGSSTDFLTATADGQRFTAVLNSVPDDAQDFGVIEGMALVSWGKAQTDPGLHLTPYLRKNTTDYEPGGHVQFEATDDWIGGVAIPLNPETSVPWATFAEIDTFQFGWKAVSA